MNCALYYEAGLAGIAGYNMISNDLKKAKIDYCLASKFTGNGIMLSVIEGLGLKREGVIGNSELLVDGRISRVEADCTKFLLARTRIKSFHTTPFVEYFFSIIIY